jgi:hypothetical protein
VLGRSGIHVLRFVQYLANWLRQSRRRGSKRGTVIRNIHPTADADEIEGRTDKVKRLVLRTEFLKA